MSWRRNGRRQAVVRYRVAGRQFECVIDRESLQIIDAGICLSGTDEELNLSSHTRPKKSTVLEDWYRPRWHKSETEGMARHPSPMHSPALQMRQYSGEGGPRDGWFWQVVCEMNCRGKQYAVSPKVHWSDLGQVDLPFWSEAKARHFLSRKISPKGECQLRVNPAGTAPGQRQPARYFTITHPFHPWRGRRFELLEQRPQWGQWRVYYLTKSGRAAFFPAGWTDLGPVDPFVEQARGRAIARVEDLLELANLVAGAVKEIKPSM